MLLNTVLATYLNRLFVKNKFTNVALIRRPRLRLSVDVTGVAYAVRRRPEILQHEALTESSQAAKHFEDVGFFNVNSSSPSRVFA